MGRIAIVCALILNGYASAATAAPPANALPPNNIDCKDFTLRPDGTWYAHPDAKPISIGTVKNVTTRNSIFFPHTMRLGDYDLTDILARKCGH